MEAQGYRIEENILHQDNKSTILLQENGRKILFPHGPSEKGNLRINYCPTDDNCRSRTKMWYKPQMACTT